MLTRLSTSALLFLCALACTQFTAAAATVAAPAVSDQLFFNVWNPATGQFQALRPVVVSEGGTESKDFTRAIPDIEFPEPGNPSHISDAVRISKISGTITSDKETTPGEAGGAEGPFTLFSLFVDLTNDTGMTMFGNTVGETFSVTETGTGRFSQTKIEVPGFHPMIPGDDVDIKPFTITFRSDLNEVGTEGEETFKDNVFTIVFQSDADVPEPATLALVGGSLLLLGIIDRRRRKSSPRQRVLTPSMTV